MMWIIVFASVFLSAFVSGTEFTLPGECPKFKLHEDLDYTKFSGKWYNAASYASDGRPIYDCSTLDFQEDSHGFIMRETYVVEENGNRIQKTYMARIDPTFDAGNKAKFIVSHENNDKVLQFPFYLLTTDYDSYALAYTCKTLKKKIRTHYVFTWLLTRTDEKLQGERLEILENVVLLKYPELFHNRKLFAIKEFNNDTCAFTDKHENDSFTSSFW